MYKISAIKNKRKKNLKKKERLNALYLRNKFLGEWVAAILGLDENKKKIYIKKIIRPGIKEEHNKFVIKKLKKTSLK